eukprot:4453066-Pyramimonas_sp.AAC.1
MQGYGVFRFDSKYGANVDGYSPIWSPNEWSETGDSYKAGAAGLAVWCVPSPPCAASSERTLSFSTKLKAMSRGLCRLGLLASGLGFAGYLIYSTSAL